MNIKNFIKNILPAILLLLAVNFNAWSQNEKNFEISKNLEVFISLFNELNKNYVDDIHPGELMQTSIEAMLETLDPYTVYIPEADVEDYRMITTGQYGGIGALIHKNGQYVVISEPYKGFPAHMTGLKAGDRLLKINGEDMTGKASDEVSRFLKGQPGTTVSVEVERNGEPAPLAFELKRENITIKDIPYYGMLNDRIGYIRLSGFTQNAGSDVKKAYVELQNKYKPEGMILDLRNNGGGLLHEAVNVTNIFVDKGSLVVSTKGKLEDKNQEHRTRFNGIDTKTPIVILINAYSASASEIVAGAIQDMDRGVVLGQRSFGKGLVQNVIPLSYNSQLKVTVAKYYIPSGRCIQAIDYSLKDDEGYFTKIPDSLVTEFKTLRGRPVYDGGGITPDISMAPRKYSPILASLLTKFLIFDYATQFARENPSIPTPEDFVITDEIYDDFTNFLSDKDYDYTTMGERKMKELKKAAREEGYYDAIADEFEVLHQSLMHNKEEDLINNREEISEILKIEIVTRYYYQEGKVRASLHSDPEVIRAISILENPGLYSSILDGSYTDEEEANPREPDKEQG
jgi:carboxyl-terminal processing protease